MDLQLAVQDASGALPLSARMWSTSTCWASPLRRVTRTRPLSPIVERVGHHAPSDVHRSAGAARKPLASVCSASRAARGSSGSLNTGSRRSERAHHSGFWSVACELGQRDRGGLCAVSGDGEQHGAAGELLDRLQGPRDPVLQRPLPGRVDPAVTETIGVAVGPGGVDYRVGVCHLLHAARVLHQHTKPPRGALR